MINAVLIYLAIGLFCGWLATRGGCRSTRTYTIGVLCWPIAVVLVVIEIWRIWRRKRV